MADGSQINGVHPFAALFPMLDDEALDELAADIAENGLNHPLLIDRDGLLIDGRNRLEACRRAEVEPRFETFEGDEAAVLRRILSDNIRRRHLTRGQCAMSVAMVYPEPEKLKRADVSSGNNQEGVNKVTLSKARLVLKETPTVAPAVFAGTRTLNDAYAEAVKVRDQNESVEGRLQRLTEGAFDLATQVREQTMSLLEAEGAYQGRLAEAKRVEEERERRARSASTCLETILAYGQIDDDPKATLAIIGDEPVEGLSVEACRKVSSYLAKLADLLEDER
jgi:hypothetical protein